MKNSNQTTNKNLTVLAVGAAGHFAGLVVPELAKRGARIRGLIQDPKQRDAVIKNGAAEVVVGDLTDRASIDAALKGVNAVFYIAPAFIAGEAEIGKSMVEAAKRAGVCRFVFSSVIDPVISALENHIEKAPVEEAIIESGMEFVLLQPTLFFQNIAGAWAKVVETSTYGEPWSDETRFSRVDYRDVAEAAALALTEDRLLYGTYQLCSEGIFNRKEVANLMSEVLGKKIEAVTVTPPAPKPADKSGNAGQPSPTQRMFDWYNRRGLVGNALVLRAILGREPRSLRAYFEELVAQPLAARSGK